MEILTVAWAGVVSNKLRSLLTMLGVIIGVSAVIVLVSVGQGASAQISGQIQGLGSNMITVIANRALGGRLEFGDAQEMLRRVPYLSKAVPVVASPITAKWQDKSYDTNLMGVTQDFPEVRNFAVQRGRFITADQVAARSKVAVVGQTVVDRLFDGQLPLGQTIRLSGGAFTVIGVMAPKGASFGQDNDDQIYVPVTAAQRLIGTNRVSTIYAQARSGEDAPLAVAEIKTIWGARFKNQDALRIMSQDQILQTVSNVTGIMTFFLGSIAGISLLVGGIGIMNIMLVSVTERTREIGIRKAIGAKRRHVLGQFLAEAVILSMTGGLIGVSLGITGSRLVSQLGGISTSVTPSSVLLSFGFAAAVGMFFGMYPAVKASNLDPIEALRYE